MDGYNHYFPNPLVTRHLANGTDLEVLQEFIFDDPIEGRIIVPILSVTDLASTPRFLWAFLPPHGKYKFAAVIHDFLYRSRYFGNGFVAWRRSDHVMWRAMLYAPSEVSPLVRSLIFLGLMLAGWMVFFQVRARLASLWEREDS